MTHLLSLYILILFFVVVGIGGIGGKAPQLYPPKIADEIKGAINKFFDRGEGVSKNITQNNQGRGGVWPKITDDIDKEAGRKKLIHSESQTTNHHKCINSFS